jgi:hypothetical protein
MYIPGTLYEQDLNKYVHEHEFCFVNTCFVYWLYNVYTCQYMIHPVSYHEHAQPFSAQSTSLRYAIDTRLCCL